MKITLDILDQRIDDLIHGHAGSYSTWLQFVAPGRWHKALKVQFDREDCEEGTMTGRMTITRRKVQKGLSIMANEYPTAFGDFMNERDDDWTFDAAMQCIVFGKVIYG